MLIRYKNRKQPIIIAALIIFVCIVLLTGATLAIFTSNPNDGTIGIVTTAGNIEVDIVDENYQTLVGRALSFDRAVDDDSPILFEPGAVFRTEGFKVINEGDIILNFRLYISEDEDMDMEEFIKAFDIWISTDPNKPEEAEELQPFEGRLGTEKIKEDVNGEPLKRESETYYLFVKMKEDAGNTFQNKEYDGIGITVYAVQGNVNIEESIK